MLPIGLFETREDVNANDIKDLDESVDDPSASADIESISVGHISIEEHSPRCADTCMCHSSAGQSYNHDGPNRRAKTYRRRWLGIAQIALLNIIMSWNWLTFAPIASSAASYYSTTESTINWLTIVVSFSFVVVSPLVLRVLHLGPRPSILMASAFTLLGNWARYGASSSTEGGILWLVIVGQILVGFAQPFVLAVPTTYSNLWFTSNSRVTATAIMTLANPFGGALGQLVLPFWVDKPADISRGILYISIISSIGACASLFLPASPPTPASMSSSTSRPDILPSLLILSQSLEVYLIVISFAVYIGLFTSISSLLSQTLSPYGFSDEQAGIGGAILIVAGVVAALITSPILDRTKSFLLTIKTIFPVAGICYLVYVWLPETQSVVGLYIVLGVLGASSFSLMPVALEYLVDLSHPVGLEVTSVIAWSAGQLLGGCFILICNALQAGGEAKPPKNMKSALIFQAVIALAVVPLPLCLGLFGRSQQITLTRIRTNQP
ncbi:major facilitator superfamily domain-containing protein [Trichoderma asperelloides]|nr:major facilitator superfamily domain-containing protein [Trichoderma asperelloides]